MPPVPMKPRTILSFAPTREAAPAAGASGRSRPAGLMDLGGSWAAAASADAARNSRRVQSLMMIGIHGAATVRERECPRCRVDRSLTLAAQYWPRPFLDKVSP